MSYLHSDSYNEFIRCDVECHKKLGMSSLNTNRFLNKKFKIQSNNWCQSQGSWQVMTMFYWERERSCLGLSPK